MRDETYGIAIIGLTAALYGLIVLTGIVSAEGVGSRLLRAESAEASAPAEETITIAAVR